MGKSKTQHHMTTRNDLHALKSLSLSLFTSTVVADRGECAAHASKEFDGRTLADPFMHQFSLLSFPVISLVSPPLADGYRPFG